MLFVWLNLFTYRAHLIYILTILILLIPRNEEQRQGLKGLPRFWNTFSVLECGILWMKLKSHSLNHIFSWYQCGHSIPELMPTLVAEFMGMQKWHCLWFSILHWAAFHCVSVGAALLVLVHMELLGGVVSSGLQQAKQTHAHIYWEQQ